MDDKFFLSVVVPAYNLEKLIERCLDSVFLKQKTDYPIEVIVVDDGSSDGTREVLSKYKENLSSAYAFRIFHCKHGGLSATANFGLSQAEGKYILFLDGDDYLVENALDGLLRFADDTKADVIAYLLQAIRPDGRISFSAAPPKCTIGRGTEIMYSWRKCGFYTAARTKMVSRRYLLDHDLFFLPGVLYEDVPWTAKLFAFDPLVAYYDKCIYTCEKQPGSITRRKRTKTNLISLRTNYEHLSEFISGISDAGYVREAKGIMAHAFFNIVTCLHEVQEQLTPEEKADFLAFLEKEKSIIKFSAEAHRRYLYRFIAEVFGVGALVKIKK